MKDENEMIRKINSSVSFRLELRMEFLFNPEHFFSVGKYFHSTERWQDCIYSKLEATVFFFFYIARNVDSVESSSKLEDTRGVVCNFHAFIAMSSISRRRAGGRRALYGG